LIVGVVVAAFGFSSLFIYVSSMNAFGLLMMAVLLPVLMRRNRKAGV